MTKYEKAMLVIAILDLVINALALFKLFLQKHKKSLPQRPNSGRLFNKSFKETAACAVFPFASKYTPFRPKVKIFLAVKIFFYLLNFSTFALASPIFALHDVKVIANKTNAASASIFFQIFHFKSSNYFIIFTFIHTMMDYLPQFFSLQFLFFFANL